MNPKMKSAIEKITLNDATFSNEVIEPTYVNFFYGKNGAGKSTIARTFKANDERLQYATITISFRQRCFNAVCLDLEMAFLLKNLEMEN